MFTDDNEQRGMTVRNALPACRNSKHNTNRTAIVLSGSMCPRPPGHIANIIVCASWCRHTTSACMVSIQLNGIRVLYVASCGTTGLSVILR